AFDGALSSLVVGFMSDAAQGVREMARVTRPGGVVALCAWDRGRMAVIARFWDAVARVTGDAPTDRAMVGSQDGDIARLLETAGLREVSSGGLRAEARDADFEDLWSGYVAGIGPVGRFLDGLPPTTRSDIREALRAGVPDGPFTLEAVAW